ncbi:MAG: DUF6449 domain-containing protein [Lachnospiraceae bacterium]|nr:DUF6449 domain-containing protein [Lachnospiraceae bacterium]
MTSKISFSKLVRSEMRKLNWLLAVQIVTFVLFFPFRALMAMAMRQNELTRYGQADYSAVEQFCRNVGLGQIENTCVILCAGAVCALVAFIYVHSQVKQDFYHSLALKREELFAVKYIGSALTFVIAYLISQLLVILVGLFYQVATLQIAGEIVLAGVQGILFYLCSYSTTLVAVMLTGNLLTTVLGIGMFGAYLPMMIAIVESFQAAFWSTQVEATFQTTVSQLRWTSPWAWCLYATKRRTGSYEGVTGRIPGIGNLCQLVAIAAVLTLIALALYRIRKTEAGGRALAFSATEPVIKILAAVPVSLVAGLIVYQLVQSAPIELICILLFGALTCVVIEFIYRMDIRQVLSHKWHFAVTAVIACAVFFTFRLDLTGYDTYLPAEEELASMAVSDYRSMCVNYGENGEIMYVSSMRTRLDAMEWENFDTIWQLAQNGVENTKEAAGADVYDEEVTYIYFKYHLKNGKEVYRYYPVDTALFRETMNELIREDEFRELYYPISTWDDAYISKISSADVSIYGLTGEDLFEKMDETEDETESEAATTAETETGLVDEVSQVPEAEDETADETANESESESAYYYYEYYGSLEMSIPLSRLPELVAAYCEDLKVLSFEEINDSYGQLYFYFEGTYFSDIYPVSESYTNTLEVLKEVYEEQKE